MTKIVVDTNILLYSMDTHSQYYQFAWSVLDSADYEICITSKNISETIAAFTKYGTLPYNDLMDWVESLLFDFRILHPNHTSLNIFNTLCRKYEPRKTHVYDIEIISIMLANDINSIATVNTKDFSKITEIKMITHRI